MKNLDLKKAASDLAFDTITQNAAALDVAIANQATELQLPDPQYQAFKQSVAVFRQHYQQAAAQDAQEAARAAALAKRAPRTPSAPPLPDNGDNLTAPQNT